MVAIARGIHLLPFRTEKLSPFTPMVLPQGGRVGSRLSLNEGLSVQTAGLFLFSCGDDSITFILYSSWGDADNRIPDTGRNDTKVFYTSHPQTFLTFDWAVAQGWEKEGRSTRLSRSHISHVSRVSHVLTSLTFSSLSRVHSHFSFSYFLILLRSLCSLPIRKVLCSISSILTFSRNDICGT